MHIHKDRQEIKASGYIRKKGLDLYEIAITYGQSNPVIDRWKEVVQIDKNGSVVDSSVRTFLASKLMNNTELLTDRSISVLMNKFREYDEKEVDEAIYTISRENSLRMSRVNKSNLKIASFYATSTNPKHAQKKDKPRLLSLRDIKKTNIKKIEHPRLTFYDYSHTKTRPHRHAGISLLNGRKLAENIAKMYGTENFETAFVKYIIDDLGVDKAMPIVYQSMCVPHAPHMQLGNHGAQYILSSPEFFYKETNALITLQREHGYHKIKFCIPNVKTAEEVEGIKRLLHRKQVTRSHSFQLLVTVEVPSAIFTLDAILSVGVDGVVCDVHKLARYILALDTHLYEQKKHIHDAAVTSAMSAIIKTTERWHIPCYLLVTEEDTKFVQTIPNLQHVNVVVPYFS